MIARIKCGRNSRSKTMQDNEIIDLYFARDDAAIAETSDKYGAYCYRVAHNILGIHEDSEECVNDTYLAAWNSMPPERPKVLKLFLAKITRSKAFDKWRKSHAAKRSDGEMPVLLDELSECVPGGTDPAEAVLFSELSESINGFLKGLPERERQIFLRRYFFSDSVKAISKAAELSENAVSVMLFRTRAKLKDHLVKEGHLV